MIGDLAGIMSTLRDTFNTAEDFGSTNNLEYFVQKKGLVASLMFRSTT